MRVSFVAEFVDFGVGGINAQVYRLFNALEAKGIDVSLNGSMKDADIVHAHSPFAKAFAATLKEVPTVATVHTIPENPAHYLSPGMRPLVRAVGWRYFEAIYPRFSRRIVPTQFTKDKLESHHIPVERVLSNGVDLTRFKKSNTKEREFRDSFGIDGPYVLSVGDIRPAKNIDLLPSLAKELSHLQFIHIGTWNKWAPSVYRTKIFARRPANLHFLGRVEFDALVGAYSGATTFIHPSKIETEGLVILESLACKTPVIARNIPVYKGFLTPKQNALLCNNREEFVKNVEQISQNKKLRQKLSQTGHLSAKERSFAHTVNEHIKLYEELTS